MSLLSQLGSRGVTAGMIRVTMGVKQGDSGQRSKPFGLINYFVVDNSYDCFY